MIKIERSPAFWNNLESKHKEFFLVKRDLKKSITDFKEDYEKFKLKFYFSGLPQRRLKFLEYLELNICDILTGKPNFLRAVIQKSLDLDVRLKRKKVGKNEWANTVFQKKLMAIFNYDNDFSEGPKSKTLQSARTWTAYHLTDLLSINVCPYCNRIFTNTHYSLDDGRTRPHLDHYYDKATYPFLALSLYNIIPSCYSCNSNFKGTKNFYELKHFHPYENSMGNNLKFTLEPLKKRLKVGGKIRNGYDLEFTNGNLEAFNLKVDTSLEKDKDVLDAWTGSNNTFHIEEMHQTHKDILTEIIQKSKIYKDEYLEWLDKKYVGSIFKSRAEIEQMITGNYNTEKDFEKRPLAKLTYDISKELKLLK